MNPNRNQCDMRKAFENYASDNGKWPGSIQRDGNDNYILMQTQAAWTVWQAACESVKPDVSDKAMIYHLGACIETLEAERDALKAEAEDLKHDIGRYIQQASALAEEVERLKPIGPKLYALVADGHIQCDEDHRQLEIYDTAKDAELARFGEMKIRPIYISAATEDQPQ